MKNNIRFLTGFLAAFVVLALIILVLVGSPKQPEHPESPPMVIGTYYWPGVYWVDVAREKGWFEEAGLDVTFVDANPDYYGAVADVGEGRLDTFVVWLFDAMALREQGQDVAMVLATDESKGSEALVATANIDSVTDLKGQRIGVPLDTALVYSLDVMLSRFGMTIADVELVDMEAEVAAETLSAGDVDAVMTWEPYASDAAASGNRLYDTGKTPGLTTAGMIFRRQFIEERPHQIRLMLQVWHRATQFIHSEPEAAFAIVAKAQGVSPGEVAEFAEINHILDLRDNVQAFTYASGLESLFGSARRIQRFVVKHEGPDAGVINPEAVVEGRFVRGLARQETGQ